MFAYIIIGIELAILYFVFWVVFIREPRPREIRAELWGRYASAEEELLENTKQPAVPSMLFIDQERLDSYLPSRVSIHSYGAGKSRKRRHRKANSHANCSCICHERSVSLNNYGWCAQANEKMRAEQANRKFAERFLLLLNRTLNNLSVKIP